MTEKTAPHWSGRWGGVGASFSAGGEPKALSLRQWPWCVPFPKYVGQASFSK